ncbi:LysR family transcriptional regulator [Aestuariivita boseongensis]|uniref:LysR family transcriptional regulator n=1 Tax=Aestuariivita boseongensis TaxID=1470562 RepID=UPI0006830648|nr:LysR family transcriptional regulator [Aestuariivita boseongensis]
MRNLDITTLRSFVAVADSGGVTRAAGFLHLTQSAVSMQLKRLEESLNLELLDRSGRGVTLTAAGEQLLGYARRILELNDEAWGRLTAKEYEGEITLGVPHDIIYPAIPQVLRRFATDFPRMQVKLISSPTRALREMFGRGQCDVIITTEDQAGPGGEVLVRLPLVWIGATDGTAWKRDPLPVAFCSNCIFRPDVLRRLDGADMPWEMVVESDIDNAVEAVVSADLAVTAVIKGSFPRQTGMVDHGGTLPDPGETRIIMYGDRADNPVITALCGLVRSTYRNVTKTPEHAQLSA